MTSQEDKVTGRGTHRKTNSQEDELGTAQPQLVNTLFNVSFNSLLNQNAMIGYS